MTDFASRKRKRNCPSSSSCNSTESNENSMETGYTSDNSTSDIETINGRHERGGKFSLPSRNDSVSTVPLCKIVKKHFPLHISDRKRVQNSDEDCCTTLRKRAKCTSKNAIMARKNRERKKQYLSDLQQKIRTLRKENELLEEEKKRNGEVIKELGKKVKYLKSVLANSPEIYTLLKSLHQNTGLPVRSSLSKYTNYEPEVFGIDLSDYLCLPNDDSSLLLDDTQNDSAASSVVGNSSSVGVCFHVAKGRVSQECCPSCSKSATSWDNNWPII